ncbi:hypothetical protein B0H11DRAFT_330379 [Mycena galericulata]|nr:hypothetical protein B0H11DRAFT_330379 [Mycena galericulata]
MLGRFPRRNQFVSQHIWKKTGQYRTAKQVGSRLQQLRESKDGPELQKLLFPAPKSHSTSHALDFIIFIDILPPGGIEQPPETPLRPWSESHNTIHVSHYPRQLACIDPTVTFVSPLPLLAESKFIVHMDETVVHVEQAPLTVPFEGFPSASGVLHCAALVPGYWETLLKCPDPTRYKIFHEVGMVEDGALRFSAQYVFRYGSDGSMII